MEEQLNQKILKKQGLESQVKEMTYRISDLNAARNTLHEKMQEQDQEITTLKAEKAHLEKKRQTILVELRQKQTQLEQQKVENEKRYYKLQDLKSKRTA